MADCGSANALIFLDLSIFVLFEIWVRVTMLFVVVMVDSLTLGRWVTMGNDGLVYWILMIGGVWRREKTKRTTRELCGAPNQ